MTQSCLRNKLACRLVCFSLVAVSSLLVGRPARAANLVQEFYLPMPEPQLYSALDTIQSGISTSQSSIYSIIVTGNGTVIYYDQWEDGYETDLGNPTQASTQIWGDGNDAHGIPPGFAHNPLGLPAGTVITLTNTVPLPRNPSVFLYDGRDRIAATKALVVTHAGWPVSPGPVFGGAVSVLSTIDYGTNYVSPVGQDMITVGLFKYVGLFVMASQNGTVVTIDPDGPGPALATNIVLNQGESFLYNGGIKKGASIVASKPVQAHLMIGDVGNSYAADWFTLYPVQSWSSAYYTPVSSAASGSQPAYVYLYNSNPTNLTINYKTLTGTGSFTVPASNGVYQFQMPIGSGASFTSSSGSNFYALCTVAANNSSDSAYNWGFTLLPAGGLTTEADVGWAPGSSDDSVDGNPVWVTPLAATRIYVDYKGDHLGPLTDPNGNQYDTNYDLAPLQSQKIYAPGNNQTAMRVYTLSGTPISAAWGEDADKALPGLPYIDAGTTVLPFPVPVLKKSSIDLTHTNGPTTLGDTLLYTVEIDNKGLLPLGNVVVIDLGPTNLLYVTNTTTFNDTPIPDASGTNNFPLSSPGYTIPVILQAGTSVFQYQVKIVGTGSITNTVEVGGTALFAQNSVSTATNSSTIAFTVSAGSSVSSYSAGTNIYVQLTDPGANNSNFVQTLVVVVNDTSTGDFETVPLVETGTNTGVFINTNGLPTSTSAGILGLDGTLHVAIGDTVTVNFTDPIYGNSCSSSATITGPQINKILYLAANGTNGVQALNRINPAATAGYGTNYTSINLGSSSGVIALDSVTIVSNTTSLVVTNAHITSAGANRLMLVGISINRGTGGSTFETPTNVTYAGIPLVQVGGRTNLTTQEAVVYIFALTNPPAGSNNVVVNWNQTQVDGDVIGCATFTGVNQSTPYGAFFSNTNTSTAILTNVSLVVTSAPGELVFDTVMLRSINFGTTGSPGPNQTTLWKTYFNSKTAAGSSTQPGAVTVTNTWTTGGNNDWTICGISIKPAVGVGGTNTTAFTQTPAFVLPFTIASNQTISVTAYIIVTNGTVIGNTNITATLQANGVNFITLTNPVYTQNAGANSNLVWTGTLSTNITIPANQVISCAFSNSQSGVTFHINYDTTNQPSQISLPAVNVEGNVIHVTSLGIYDVPYPGGNLVTAPVAGSKLYVRATVTDPFGTYDISSVNFTMTGPSTNGNVSATLTSPVATTATNATYEYFWPTGSTTGDYNVSVTANEGSEGILDVAGTSLTLAFLDLGTPSTTEFTSGNNGPDTNNYAANSTVWMRVTDLNRNTNATTVGLITAILTSSAGGSNTVVFTETSTNTGVFTASILTSTNGSVGFLAPVGSILTVTYTDPTDLADRTMATAIIVPSPGVAGVAVNKTIVSPVSGQPLINNLVQFNLQVVNTGSTTLTNVVLADNFPSASLSFQTASLPPTSTNANSLVWTNIGSLTSGQSTNISVFFNAITAGAVTNNAVVSSGLTTNNTGVPFTIANPAVTVTKTLLSPSNSPVSISSNVVFRIIVQNTGNTTIPTLPMEDYFSAAYLQYVSATIPADGSGAGSLLWTNLAGTNALAVNASITNDITMLVVGAGTPALNNVIVDYAVDSSGNSVPPSSSTCTNLVTSAATISGHVYEDINHTGTYTNGDTGLSSVALALYSDPSGTGTPGTLVQIVITDANGYYEFLNLTLGHYVVVGTSLPGYVTSAPANGLVALNLTVLTSSVNNNFFQYQPSPAVYGNIGGTVYYDTNGSGAYTIGDGGIANVEIDLVQDLNTNGLADPGEPVVASTTTETNGNYTFLNATPGYYVVRQTFLFGYYNTGDSSPPNNNQIPIALAAGLTTNNNNFYERLSPIAANDTNSGPRNLPIILYPLTNDISPNGDTLTITNAVTTNGIVVVNGGSTNLTYTPASLGLATIAYTISDAHGGTSTATISVNVTNIPPVAVNDMVAAFVNVPVTITPVTNDYDANGDSLVISLVSPTNGIASIVNNTNVLFTPATNFSGTATIGYTISDGYGGTASAVITVNVSALADLGLGKLAPANVFAASNLTYTISVTNFGPSSASSVVVTDSLPTGVTFVNASGSGANNGDVVNWALGTLANGQVSNVTVTVTAPANGSLTNTASVSSPTSDPNLTNNVTPPVVTGVTPLADVGLGKSGPAGIIFGTNFNYTIAVTNFGPSTATSLTVTDSLPAGIIFVSAVPAAATNASSQVVWTNLGTLAAGATTNLTLTVISTTRGSMTNVASGGSPVQDPNSTNNLTPPVVTAVTNNPPVANPDNHTVAENTTNTFSPLTNDVVLTPGGSLSLIAVNPTTGTATISGTNVIFTPTLNFVGTATIGYTITDNVGGTNSSVITVTVTNLPPTANGQSVATTENTAKGITLTGSDPTSLPLTFIIVTGPANGSLTAINTNTGAVTYTPNANYLGTDTFTFRVNNGYNNSPVVSVSITVTNIPPVANPASYTVLENSTNTFAPLTNDLVETPGGTLQIISVSATNGMATILNLTNVVFTPTSNFVGTATIGYTITDGIGGANSSLITVTVQSVADLAVNKTGPATVYAATNFSYTVTVTNLGPGAAASLSVTDNLPAAVSFVSASAGATINGSLLVWTNLGSLAANAATNLTVTVTAPLTGISLTNLASGGSLTSDPNPTNNTSLPVITGVTPSANLAIGKTAPSNVSATGSLTYTISVTNNGPSSASSVVVTDALPAGVTFVTASGNFANNSGVVNWALGTLASGQTSNLTVTVTAPASGTLTNVASVSSPTADTNLLDNVTPPVITTVALLADLAIGKSAPANVFAASNLTYTISVTNFGPSSASSVVVTDSLPVGVTFENASGNGSNNAGAVSWNLGVLAAGQSSNLTVTVTAPANGSLTNLASVSSPTGDPNLLNNTSPPVVTTVTPVADLAVAKTGVASGVINANFNYTMSVTNFGPSSAANFSVTDSLPAGIIFVSALPAATTNIANQVIWNNLGPLAANATTNLTLTVQATSRAAFTNLATVGGPTLDNTPTNNTSAPVVTSITNRPPVAVNDTASTARNVAVMIPVLANDSDPDGDALTIVSISSTNGTASINGANIIYTPTNAVPGTNIFSYTITDGFGGTNSALVTVNVTNRPPVAVNDLAGTPENIAVTIPVLANDSDPDGDALTIVSVSPTNGTAIISGTNVVFTPATNFVGTATAGYQVRDNFGGTNGALITITITNVPPTANPDSYAITENTTNWFAVLVNDVVNTPGGNLTLLSVSTTNGVATVSGTNIVFTPAAAYRGPLTLNYIIIDNIGGTNSSYVTVLVTNIPPVANPDSYTVLENTANTFAPLTNDLLQTPGGTLQIIGVSPTNGTATILNLTNVVFTPASNFVGTATIGYTITDGIGGTNSSLITVTVPSVADLAVSKSGPAAVYAATNYNYIITVTNLGPGAAASLSVTDNLPAAVALVSSTAGATLNGSQLVWTNLGSLAANAATNLAVTVTAPLTGISLTNLASAGSPTSDPNPTNNTSLPVVTAVTPIADLVIVKTAPASVLATSNVLYTISVTNLGPSSASSVAVTDSLPAGVTFVNASGGGLNNSGVVNWSLGVLAAGQSSNLTVTVIAPASGSLTNIASVSSPTPDTNLLNNVTPPVVTTVGAVADLAIGKTAAASVFAVSNLTYTISVTNFGPSTASSVTVTDNIPNGASFIGASGGWANNSGVVVWSLGNLANGIVSNITLTVTAPASGTLTNVATVDSPTSDLNPTNNATPPVLTSVTPLADLVIAKTGPVNVFAASNCSYTISVTNLGPSSASSVVVTDSLPNGVTFVNASGNGSNNASVVSWNLGVLAAGQSSNLTVTVTAPASGTLTNIASVSSPTGDTNLLNNITPPVITAVTPLADVSVVKSGPAGIVFGTNFNYTLTVSNAGPSTVVSLSVTDSLPAGLVFVSAVPATTTNASNQVIWNLGNFAADTGSNLTLTVISTLRGSVTNVATGGSPTPDPVLTNNTAPPVVTAVTNNPPIANSDSYAVTENTTNLFSPLLNDVVQTPGGNLTIVFVSSTNGLVSILNGTNIVFTPANNFLGNTTLGYTISDNVGGTSSSFISVLVTNIPPVANPASYAITENTTNLFPVLVNDLVQTPGGSLTLLSVSTTNGVVTISDTNIVFTPAANYRGALTLNYSITDSIGGTNSSFVTVLVTNIPPLANSDVYTVAENTTNAFAPLANDLVQTPGGTLQIIGVSPTNGTATILNLTNVVFTPASNFVGTATIGYSITDGIGGTNSSLITVTVTNLPPTAFGQSVATTENIALSIMLAGSDPAGRPLTFAIVSGPTGGPVTGLDTNTGAVTYTPTNNFTGTDTFTFRVNDGYNNSATATISITVTPTADLLVAQSGPAGGVAGANLVFTVAVTNLGPASATNVVVTNQIAGGYTFVSASASGVTNGNLVTWMIPVLPANGATNLTVTLFAVEGGTFTNTASGNSLTPDLNAANNNGSQTNAQVVTTVSALADVAVFKSGNTSVLAGGMANYSVLATNFGPSTASNVVVSDNLPVGTTLVNASGNYSVNSGVITWSAANLPGGAATNFTVTLTAPAGGSLTNIASSTAGTADPNPGNNDGSSPNSAVITLVTPVADLSIGKSAAASALATSNLVYTISVTNFGPSIASSVTVTDNIPNGASFIGASGGWANNSGVVIWTLGNLSSGAVSNVTLTVAAPASGSLTNIAMVGSPTGDPNSTNNMTPPVITTVTPLADLQITKTAPASVLAVSNLTYAIVVTNFGPSSASSVVVTDSLPIGGAFVNASGSGANNSGVVSWNLGSLAAGQSSNLTVTVTASASGVLTNIATVASPTSDPNPTNNLTPPVITSVTPLADLIIAKSGPATVLATSNVVYTISVTNFGPSSASSVTVTDVLAAGVSFINASGSGANNFGVVIWNLGNLASGAASNVTLTVAAPASGSMTNIASVGSPTGDTNILNNTTPPVITAVTSLADLAIGKTAAASVFAVSNLTYSISVTNFGPSTASSVTVTDAIPNGASFIGASGGGANNSGTVIWNLGDLVNGAVSNVTVTVITPASGTLTNIATVGSPTGDPNPTNNVTPPVLTSVTPLADLIIAKTGPANVFAASNCSYTISVTNFGPSSASSVVVTDSLPVGVTFVNASGSGSNTAGAVSWNLGALAAGQSSNLTVTVTAPASGTLTNIASVSSPTGDTNILNNTTPPVITSVTPVADLAIGKSAAASVLATSNLVYTISVTNFGPSTASSVTVTDSIPNGANFISASGGGANNSGVVIWSLGNLSSGAVSNVTLTVAAPTSGSLTNIATVGSPTSDLDPTNNLTPPVFTSVPPVADVAVGKSGPAGVTFNVNFSYTISVTNFGPSAASGILVTDALPAGVIFAGAVPAATTNAIGQVIWSVGNLAANATTNLTLTVISTARGALTNFATVGAPTFDPSATNNVSLPVVTLVTNISPVANADNYFISENSGTNPFAPLANDVVRNPGGVLQIISVNTTNGSAVISGTNVLFVPGTNYFGLLTLNYSITDNVGGTNSSVITVTVTNFPPLANPDSYTIGENSGTNTFSPLVNDTVRTPGGGLQLIGVSPTNGTATISGTNVLFTPNANFFGTATIGYTITDGIGGTSSSLITVIVTNVPPVATGQSLGISENTPVIITLTGSDPNHLPLTFAIVGNPANGTLSLLNTTTGTVIYTPGTNYTGADSFTFRVNNGQTNSAVATVNLTVAPVADLVVVESGPASGFAGSNLVFTVSVTNRGPATATSLVISNQLASGFTLVSASGAGVNTGGLVTWLVSSLPVNGVTNFTVTAFATQGGAFTNIASGASAVLDLNPANNNGSQVNAQSLTVITPVADVAVFKTGSANVYAGQTVAYVITATNAGPSTATNVVVQDTLPTGAIFQSASGSYSSNNGVVTWSGVTLAPNTVATFNLTLLAPASVSSFLNIASATSPTLDPNPTNNNGSFSGSRVGTTVTPSADLMVLLYGPASAIQGSNFVYTLVVTNVGPSVSSNIFVTDLFPSNLVFVSASSGGTFATNVITWPKILSLAVGATTNYTITAKGVNAGVFTNLASALAATYDPNPTNNTGVSPASQVQTTVGPAQFTFLAGTPILNPQTGLYEESVTVTNSGTVTVAGFQLFVGGLRSGVSLYNAIGTNNGLPYIQYNFALNPTNTVSLILEFYNPSRLAFTNSLSAVAILPPGTGTTGTNGSTAINRVFLDNRFTPARVVVEFNSVPGVTYVILYSTSLTAPVWEVATPAITANANVTQWYDDGPPETDSLPGLTRYYRIIQY
jgi:uncharacterized repeat protein (TIGR01451 family)